MNEFGTGTPAEDDASVRSEVSGANDASDADAVAIASEALSLGGSDGTQDYPEIALDSDDTGLGGRLDQWIQRATHWFNPILIKEARQSLKSRQFLVTYFCLLVASCAWTVLGVVFNAPEIYFIPHGEELLGGYYLILAVSTLAFVPLVAFRSLAAELDEGTYEMLAITRLTAWRIVAGKMNSAILQVLIYLSAIVPCLAFCYLLRGISLPAIVLTVIFVLTASVLLASFALMLSTVAMGRSSQTFLLVGLVAVIVFCLFVCSGFVFNVVFSDDLGGEWLVLVLALVMAASFVVLFLAAAAARIAPITENRSTRMRAIMFVQQVIWVTLFSYLSWSSGETEYLNVGMIFMVLYWLLIGVLICGESWELSPRVRRDLPKSYSARMLLTWWMPGPGTGFMFVISTALAGFILLALFATCQQVAGPEGVSNNRTWPGLFAFLSVGYLAGYLGLVRLVSLPFQKRWGSSFIPPLIACILFVFLGTAGPAMVDVLVRGRVGSGASPLHASNFIWMWGESFNRGGIGGEIVLLVFAVGMLILLINAGLLVREFRMRRSETPHRVSEAG
ncbi:MAG: hypothetical protein AAFV88_06015 [Planctomycetota bacterium]